MVYAVHLHLVQYLQRIAQRLWHICENVVHLLPGLKPFLLRVAQAIRVFKVFSRGDAKQVVVSLGGLLVLEVAVISAHQLHAKFLGPLDQDRIYLLLQDKSLPIGHHVGIRDLMALQLQIIIIPKHPMIPLQSFPCPIHISLEYLGGHFAGDAGRADNQVLVIPLQVSSVCTGTAIEAVYPSVAHQFDEVTVAVLVFRQDDEVIATTVSVGLHLVFLGMTRHIHLAPVNGLEGFQPLLLALFVDRSAAVSQLLDAIHHAMVGKRHAFHAVVDSLAYQVGYFGLSVKHRVLTVNVQVYEIFHIM